MADLERKILDDLASARKHLEYSRAKVEKIDLDRELGEEELETLESFSSRFARYSDIIISKYLRFLARGKDPAFRGSVVDVLTAAEAARDPFVADLLKTAAPLLNLAVI